MASWDLLSAVSSLRSLLGDNATDKAEYKADCQPSPDGVTKRFFVGQPRVVVGSLSVYLSGVEAAVSGTPDYPRGTFDLEAAPSGSIQVQASYNYQWFTDAELEEFLNAGAAAMLGFESVDDPNIVVMIRPALLDFACYYAYMRKAAEWADAVSASAGGYSVDQSKGHPNWRTLAETALRSGWEKVKKFQEGGIVDAKSPAVRFSKAYTLPPYVPNT